MDKEVCPAPATASMPLPLYRSARSSTEYWKACGVHVAHMPPKYATPYRIGLGTVVATAASDQCQSPAQAVLT